VLPIKIPAHLLRSFGIHEDDFPTNHRFDIVRTTRDLPEAIHEEGHEGEVLVEGEEGGSFQDMEGDGTGGKGAVALASVCDGPGKSDIVLSKNKKSGLLTKFPTSLHPSPSTHPPSHTPLASPSHLSSLLPPTLPISLPSLLPLNRAIQNFQKKKKYSHKSIIRGRGKKYRSRQRHQIFKSSVRNTRSSSHPIIDYPSLLLAMNIRSEKISERKISRAVGTTCNKNSPADGMR
jgi:hypothetical protein